MNFLSLNIPKIPQTITIGSRVIEVERLGAELSFARKPSSLADLRNDEPMRVYIVREVRLTPEEFDAFAANLSGRYDWLEGLGGGTGDGYLCVEVSAAARPYLFVNPEGSSYARYVARLG